MRKLVSIIIPAYQEELRIERCLKSILASTYPNLELIVVNDGSTDNTEKVLKTFQEKNSSPKAIFRFITIPNGGVARARNYGLSLAKGEYIGFVDADDMIHPEMIERLADSLEKGNDLSICRRLICNENGKPLYRPDFSVGEKRQCPVQALEMVMWEKIQMSMWAALFRREKIMGVEGEPVLLCPEDVVAFEDFAFVCQYVSRCNSFIEKLDFDGYFYCKHKGSLSTGIYTAREIRHALQPVLAVGEKMGAGFTAHKLQYAFRFMAFWYEEALRSTREDFFPDSDNWKICMKELERYADIFMKASNVSSYKKAAMWIARKHPVIGRILAKSLGKLLIRSP